MRAPFFEFGAFGNRGALVAAVLIGIAFGWCLERAGMGSARKLAGQFYLTDLTVFKVMFSAIVTAMLGAFWLGRLGVLDLSRVYVPETFVAAAARRRTRVRRRLRDRRPLSGNVVRRRGHRPRRRHDAARRDVHRRSRARGSRSNRSRASSTARRAARSRCRSCCTCPYGVAVALVVCRRARRLSRRRAHRSDAAACETSRDRRHAAHRSRAWRCRRSARLGRVAGSPYAAQSRRIDVDALPARVAHETITSPRSSSPRGSRSGARTFASIDVRTADEFDEYHVPTAERVPIDSLSRTTLRRRRDDRAVLGRRRARGAGVGVLCARSATTRCTSFAAACTSGSTR